MHAKADYLLQGVVLYISTFEGTVLNSFSLFINFCALSES